MKTIRLAVSLKGVSSGTSGRRLERLRRFLERKSIIIAGYFREDDRVFLRVKTRMSHTELEETAMRCPCVEATFANA